ncbi:Uracil-DNA glycosylase [Hondaea fermentalgiana]|uniref:Uracil-DNA glycosylase n=1 Tax=Hondaea fermentalgiana TaxID=2315210 RepID=A0A2R5GJU8_9STRA|nr:Uracil-DNA glycosylase [Hondaea fermentalgiana]|eukprot:GBG30008.1 Uracil-DNA glycosylase [Hondaea fermentalgiana]
MAASLSTTPTATASTATASSKAAAAAATTASPKDAEAKKTSAGKKRPAENAGDQDAKAAKTAKSEDVAALNLEPGWQAQLGAEARKPYWRSLDAFLRQEAKAGKQIFPPKSMVFSALELCPFDKVKVVILGQDPYHGPGQAHGLAFSVQEGIAIPPSLRNMYKEAMTDVKISKPTTGSLVPWAKQGVLLLNTVLTVRKGEANSHKDRGWEKFTDAIIRSLNKNKNGLVFMLWGKHAQKVAAPVDRSKHLVITSSHPSPLGASKTKEPFIGSKCFSRANAYLEKKGKEPINWKI